MISHTHTRKFILFGIVKTGSTSMRTVLRKYGGAQKHNYVINNVSRAGDGTQIDKWGLDMSGGRYDEYFKFCFVRNPYERVVSNYFWGKHIAKKVSYRNSTFDQFVRDRYNSWLAAVDQGHPKHQLNVKPMIDWIRDDDGVVHADFVGRYEDIYSGWDVVRHELGIEDELGYYLASPHSHYSTYYTNETRELVRKLYHEDLETFGYEFKRS